MRLWQSSAVRREIVTEGPPDSWFDRALALVATALPFGVALARAASSGQWRDDISAVRDLGLVAVGIGGGVSTLVTQALGLVPLGPRAFRAALGSVLALALAARLVYGLIRRALREAGAVTDGKGAPLAVSSSRLASTLAAVATLTAALSPTWQREATVGGGAMIATALGFASLTLAVRCLDLDDTDGREPPLPRLALLFATLGATVAESPHAALAAIAMIAAFALGRRLGRRTARPSRGERSIGPAHLEHALALSPRVTLALAAAFGVIVIALFLAPLALRPLAPRAFLDIGRALSAEGLAAEDAPSARVTALSAWMHEVSSVSLAIAAFGLALGLADRRVRPWILPAVALLALDTLTPARAAGVLAADPLTALRSLAVAAIALGEALGVFAVAVYLLRARVPMAKSGAVLIVVFHVTLVALTSEEAGFAADRSEQLASEAWADEALARLPPRAAVLARSPAVIFRLWAARLSRGERPDVLVIPAPLLGRGKVIARLLAEERELEPLLRSYALTAGPSEFSLSKLADARSLRVEYDPSWSPRLLRHTRVDGLWLEYAPETLGPSDRKLSVVASLAPVRRVVDAIVASTIPDAPTAHVVATALRAHAGVLTALGEREAADAFMDRIDDLSARDPFIAEVSLPFAIKGLRRVVTRKVAARLK